jgi:hypothetical protein
MPRQVAIVAALTLAASPAHRLTAQLAVDVSAGARYTSTLVHDSIVAPFDVRLALAPTVAVTVGTPLERGWAAPVTFDFSTSELQRHANGSSPPAG